MEHLRVLHTFIGSKPFDRRRSYVLWDRINGEYVVLMLDDGNNHVLVPSGHSEEYAESAAENWVMGVSKYDGKQWNEKTVEQDKYF